MSTLSEALNRILKWLEENEPETVSFLQPGLSHLEIEEFVKDLPIQFPPELYELYKWKNGSGEGPWRYDVAYIFNEFGFYPLEVAIEQYRPKLNSDERWKTIYSNSWLEIFFCIIGEVGGYVLVDGSQEISQVIFAYHKDADDITQKYTNLTSMMTTIAECYETGVYSVTPYKDYQIEHQIWYKHNSEIVDSVMEKLQQELTLQSLTDIAADLIKLKDPRTVKPLIQALEKPALTDDDLGIQALVVRILGGLGNAEAVELLIGALQNENWMTQYWAAVSLGQLRDKRAIDSLIEALQDRQSEVREMAAWALVEIGDLRVVDPLIEALQDSDNSDNQVREVVAWSLGEIGDIRAVEPLIDASWESDIEVRKAASKALIKLIAKFPELDEKIPF